MFLRRLVIQLLAAILGLWLAARFVPNVGVNDGVKTLFLAGFILGILNCFFKPLIKALALPLRLLTLGLFGFVINMALLWGIDILFPQLILKGILPLFWTSLIIWGLGILLSLLIPKKKR